ncbi:MAG TPA: response regulator [Thioalkalivibrio sp.]|nr:response regulator [Thioalkalivibrio sp.]
METPDNQPLRGLRLLVADDNSVNRKLLAALAANLGAHCDTVTDGAAAVSRATAEPYDCVILDLHMPEVDGYAAARAIRRLDGAPPLIAFTASRDLATCDAVLAAGFVGMLNKPLSASRLSDAVSEAISGPGTSGISSDTPDLDDTCRYNLPAALDTAGGKRALAAELFAMLRDDLRTKRRELDDPALEADQLVALVHKIHGAASHCRADRLRDMAARLETLLRREPSRGQQAEALLAQLVAEIDALLAMPDPFANERIQS